LHEPLDVNAMREAIPCLIGEHDFSSFRGAGCEAEHPLRQVYCTSLVLRDELFVYTIEATAFLRHMVRNIVGTLVQVGYGLRTPKSFSKLLEARDRTQAGPTAPPQGLFLTEVKY
jgi:tRNA pseudouridine38-40 synthase